jgi:hypothetical protein
MKRIGFDLLFDRVGQAEVGFASNAATLDGEEVEIKGYLSPAHDGRGPAMLVSAPGICPDCSPVPVPAINLPGFAVPKAPGGRAVRLRGRIQFGFSIDADGNGSFLRLVEAQVATGLPR